MICPKCGGKVGVVCTANVRPSNEIYRRRRCNECGHYFYTAEFEVEATSSFMKEWNCYVPWRKIK